MPSHAVESLVGVLKKCREKKDLFQAKQMHAFMRDCKLDTHTVLGNHLVTTMLDCGALSEAQQVFDGLPCRTERSWTSLISAYILHGHPHRAFHLFHTMQQQDHAQPSTFTFVSLLKGCTSVLTDADPGLQIHAAIVCLGLDLHLFIGNTLVGMYGKCGSHAEARHVFQSLPSRDIVTWNALIAGYAEHGHGEEALVCLEQMQQEGGYPNDVTFPSSLKACGSAGAIEKGWLLCAEIVEKGLEMDLFVGSSMVDMYAKCGFVAEADQVFLKLPVQSVISWNALIGGYAEHGLGDAALSAFEKMQLEGITPDDATYLCTLKACSIVGAVETGQKLHTEIVKRGLESGLFVSNTLIDMYGQCGSLLDGKEVFNKLSTRNVACWSAMIKAYGENNEGNMAIQCFLDMQVNGVRPNSITFTSLLGACSHASLVCEGQHYFKAMIEEHGIKPILDHYSCMVDLLARSGHIYEAHKFVDAMQCNPSEDILKALFTACKIHGEVQLGLRCFGQLVQLNLEDAPAYLMMADIYATAGRWTDACQIEGMRKHVGAKKKPANASIEVNKKLHEFVVGNKVSESMSTVLGNISSCMRYKGYMPDLDLILRYN